MWFNPDLKKKSLIDDLSALKNVRNQLRTLWILEKDDLIRKWRKKLGVNSSTSIKEFILLDHKRRLRLIEEAKEFIENIKEEIRKQQEVDRILECENDYEILGLEEHYATLIELKKNFRELAKKYHPDVGGDSKLFISINGAYKRLIKEIEQDK